MVKEGITIDSNVIIRLVVEDISDQLEKAKVFFKEIESGKKRGLVSILVINEVIWILGKYYELKREDYIPKLLQLLSYKNIKIIEVKKELIKKVLGRMFKTKFDFTDIYLSEIATKDTIFSFDKDFKKLFR